MVYDLKRATVPCTMCGSEANGDEQAFDVWQVVDCSRCGDFRITSLVALRRQLKEPKQRALASHLIRKMQAGGTRPELTEEFFAALRDQTLPTPAEASDNLILWMAEQQDGRPGQQVEVAYANPALLGTIGVVGPEDVDWIVEYLRLGGYLSLSPNLQGADRYIGYLAPSGWARFEELKRAHVASRYAFLARRFANAELDKVVDRCLRLAIAQTGFELRTVTQRAGLIDAVIEDEIRRCRFLIADLSDDNAGAYWEAGFAEGLGKPVIYICRAMEPDGKAEKKTHFDTNHRQTVRWDMASLDQTATQLKAVIRNTLLGDAKQED